MCIIINAIESCADILGYMTADKIRGETLEDECLSVLTELVLHGWPSTKIRGLKELQSYWTFMNVIAIIGRSTIKGRRIIIPT